MSSAITTQQKPDQLDGLAETLDRATGAMIAQAFNGISPATILQSYSDWWMHLAILPGKQLQLAAEARRNYARLGDYARRSIADPKTEPAIEPLPQDRRFADPAWNSPPFNLIAQTFLLNQQWWRAATTGVAGVSRHHEALVEFATRQMLDIVAPTNFILTDPVLLKKIRDTNGRCLVDGAKQFVEDMQRTVRGEPPVGAEAFRVGETVAITPGKVVFRNALIELIQYAPTTETVRPEPILIVPAWIMKYYILDLSPANSLIKWLVGQGYTVFMISWKNPGSADRDLDMEDYRRLGPMAALDAIGQIVPDEKIHAVGYCLGGTLLSIAAAAMGRDGDERLATTTFLAAQTDFTEPGELGLFIDEAQLNLLEDMMWRRGYLDSSQMGGAFQILRSNDLIWSHMLNTYLMGERDKMSDLMAWNADGTRMPYAMHSQYLHRLFLNDDLAQGRYKVEGRTIALSALHAPTFAVGTEFDHVAPWRSVHKIHMLSNAEIRFVLTSGGHNAGIVSEPGHPGRRFHVLTRKADGAALDPDDWLTRAEPHEGSWWTEWGDWLALHSGPSVPPPAMGGEMQGGEKFADAPGSYVLER